MCYEMVQELLLVTNRNMYNCQFLVLALFAFARMNWHVVSVV